MAHPHKLALAGFAATAVSFGPGRIGFGLFLPRLRESFELSGFQAGLITSLAFAAFLIALPPGAGLARRFGPRRPVMLGAALATAGFLIVAAAGNASLLATGVALAVASAGCCWTPFNTAAEAALAPPQRAGVLSIISTGASFGVLLAAACYLIAVFLDGSWRPAWAVFAAMGALALALAGAGMPAGPVKTRRPVAGGPRWALGLRKSGAGALYAAALTFGAVNAIYLAYAALRVVEQGGLAGPPDSAAAAIMFLSYGACGAVGMAAGWIESRIGLPALLAAIFLAFAASHGLIAAAPGAWSTVLISAGLHGAAVMGISAVLSFWSLRVFPGRGASAFTAALIAAALGSMLGPAAAGGVLAVAGTGAALTAAGLASLAAAAGFAFGAFRSAHCQSKARTGPAPNARHQARSRHAAV